MKPLYGFLGYYADKNGCIYTTWKRGVNPQPILAPRKLRLQKGRNIYKVAYLAKNGRMVQKDVHVLICQTFHGARPKGLQASHLNGNPVDNRSNNLAWETPSQNMKRKLQHGTHDRGLKNSRSKFTESSLKRIKQAIVSGATNVSIAKRFKVSPETIARVKRGERYGK